MQQTKSWGRVSTPRFLGFTLLGNYIVIEKKGKHFYTYMTCTYLQMPEEEREYEPDSKAHEPRDKQERATFDVCKVLKHCDPLGDLSSCLSKHLRL